METGINLIDHERNCQLIFFDSAHDSQFQHRELIIAAMFAITQDSSYLLGGRWDEFESKVKRDLNMPIANLIKAGALIAAEIDRVLNEAEIPIENLPDVHGWISFEGNERLFKKAAKRNCICMFDNGVVCKFNDPHPHAILTHFILKE
jgi:hypothetical protein